VREEPRGGREVDREAWGLLVGMEEGKKETKGLRYAVVANPGEPCWCLLEEHKGRGDRLTCR